MAPANRDDLEDQLRGTVAASWAAIKPEDVDDALARLPHAWTDSELALRVLADVNLIDPAVYGSREIIWAASREARLLFPPADELLEALAMAAQSHVSRFDYRLDLGDLDEATFLAEQVFALAAEAGRISERAWVLASSALTRADLWRFRVRGDPAFVDAAIERITEPTETGDPTVEALLAECLQSRAAASSPDSALDDLSRARQILDRLLDPAYPLPPLKELPWLEAAWGATWCMVECTAYRVTGDAQYLNRAIHLGRVAIEHTYPSVAEAEAAHLAVGLEWLDSQGSAKNAQDLAAEQVDIAIAAGKERIWYGLQSALAHAEWSLSRSWSQPGTTSARIAYDIVDQTIDLQAGEEYRRPWIPWLARAAALAAPALAAAGAAGPAASRLEQARTRVLSERFRDDTSDLAMLPMDVRAEVADPLVSNLRVLRDPKVSRVTRATARDEVLRTTLKVRERPGFEFFRWKLEPQDLLRLVSDTPIVYLTPGKPHGVAVLGGGPLGEWRSIPLPLCVSDPQPPPVATFLARTMSRTEPAGRRRAAVAPVTEWLGNAVWEPIAQLLEVDAFWIVPCGYLGLLPLHAGRLTMKGFDVALRRWDIRYAVSARSLARSRRLPVPVREPSFIGIPQPADQGALRGAQEELSIIAQGFSQARVLDAKSVSPSVALESIKAAGYLHAACHGTADRDDPLMSGLELAGGRLTLDALSGMETALELGVLSACETNVPDPSSPDEAMSLAVGLHLTGCRAVIASSWQVPDQATFALMDNLYRRWRGPAKEPITDALRGAQLQLADSENWREAYYWAGFSLLGAPPTDISDRPSAVST